ncbi:anthranilate synthase component I family protein [Algoriphagus marincola]|uniref:anthranilate synthase component I family protein n=1 Tax=Algoriphagus marincola TaxID=264027 RepID=UPI0004166619|nr:anthranilate synthase component I family protein [Algoriphagus marincola]
MNSHTYPFSEEKDLPHLLRWIDQNYSHYLFTHGNSHSYPKGPFPNQILTGNQAINSIEELEKRYSKEALAGIFSYDFKNQIEKLSSKNPSFFELPDFLFFQPELQLSWNNSEISSSQPLPPEIFNLVCPKPKTTSINIHSQTSKEEYLKNFRMIQDEIREGNTYEMNYCIAYQADFEDMDPVYTFLRLNKKSPMPFAALFKAGEKYILSASPERFLKKTGNQLIAQPIKGTAKRGQNEAEDLKNKKQLHASEKERAENLMITDLMRNDLSKVSEIGSVEVPELFGLYSFPRVHQMISTVSATLKPNATFRQIIEATFPMGSMTGAPKIKTMELIEQFENFKRGWFSGALGFINESGDFDFSVIIRSIILDQSSKKLYFAVGSAITIDAEAEQEYDECLLKANAILEVLSGK